MRLGPTKKPLVFSLPRYVFLAILLLFSFSLEAAKNRGACPAALAAAASAPQNSASVTASSAGTFRNGGHGEVTQGIGPDGVTPVAEKRARTDKSAKFLENEDATFKYMHSRNPPDSIPKYYGMVEVNGQKVLRTEWIDGRTVSETYMIDDHVNAENMPKISRDFLKNMQQLYRGLSWMHANDLLHQDIKPSNLMIDERGDLKIVDYGISARGQIVEGVTTYGIPLSRTEKYASPEQNKAYDKKIAGLVGPSADFYSMGRVMEDWHKLVIYSNGSPRLTIEMRQYMAKFKNLADRMMDDNPDRRPSPAEIEEDLAELEAEADHLMF